MLWSSYLSTWPRIPTLKFNISVILSGTPDQSFPSFRLYHLVTWQKSRCQVSEDWWQGRWDRSQTPKILKSSRWSDDADDLCNVMWSDVNRENGYDWSKCAFQISFRPIRSLYFWQLEMLEVTKTTINRNRWCNTSHKDRLRIQN